MLSDKQKIEKQCLDDFMAYTALNKYGQHFVKQLLLVTPSYEDKPDIVLCNDGFVYGIEHFQVNAAAKLNYNDKGLSVVFADNDFVNMRSEVFRCGQLDIVDNGTVSDLTLQRMCDSLEELSCVVSNITFSSYMCSFSHGLMTHVKKIDSYMTRLSAFLSKPSCIHLYFMIDVAFPFSSMKWSVSSGCIVSEMVQFLRILQRHGMLSGVIFVMRDMFDRRKYSATFIDMTNEKAFDKCIRAGVVCPIDFSKRFDALRNAKFDSVEFRRHDGVITFIAHKNVSKIVAFPN